MEAAGAFGLIIFYFLFLFVICGGTMVGCIFGCKVIAESKGVSHNYMWFGLLGMIGIIILAFIKPVNKPVYVSEMLLRANGDVKKCANCGGVNGIDSAFCGSCGSKLD